MAANTDIEWCDHTFNPWWGCSKVSSGCDHCYAERIGRRFGVAWGPGAARRTFGDKHWDEPRRWDRRAARESVRRRVFCASMGDVFDNEAPPGERERLWQIIRETPHLDWLLLTKRIGNAESVLPADWDTGYSNAWLMMTAVNQMEVERDVPKLLSTPARIYGLSLEPLLENIVVPEPFLRLGRRAWVIAGGESGPGARPVQPNWVRRLRDQCVSAGVAFFFKQWGAWAPINFGTYILDSLDRKG